MKFKDKTFFFLKMKFKEKLFSKIFFFEFHFIINNLFFRNLFSFFFIENSKIELNNNKRCLVG